MLTASAIWRRLDLPGHDACWLLRTAIGWQLRGHAIFRDEFGPVSLSYNVDCDSSWATTRGEVRGWLGQREVEMVLERTAEAGWTLNGLDLLKLGTGLNLDFNFTPATNLPHIRRANLAEGEMADMPIAWLEVEAGSVTVLPQRYERRSEFTYWYQAPTVGYEGLLEMAPNGFVRSYPNLWTSEL